MLDSNAGRDGAGTETMRVFSFSRCVDEDDAVGVTGRASDELSLPIALATHKHP